MLTIELTYEEYVMLRYALEAKMNEMRRRGIYRHETFVAYDNLRKRFAKQFPQTDPVWLTEARTPDEEDEWKKWDIDHIGTYS